MFKFVLLGTLFLSLNAFSQNVVISFVIENSPEEVEPQYISVLVNGNAPREMKVNKNSISLSRPPGFYKIVLSYTGFRNLTHLIDLKKDTLINARFYAETSELEQVTVNGRFSNMDRPVMGVERISVKELLKTPILMGELDIQRGLQTLPGVSSVGEGANGLNIRGGSTDQNLILLEGTPIYNPTHLFGLISVVPSEAVSGIDLHKGLIPVKYGGRIASVIDLKTPDPSDESLKLKGGIGLLASKFSIETPLINQKLSVKLAARSAFTGFMLNSFRNLKSYDGGFNEIYTKLLYKPGKQDRVSFMLFHTDDFTQVEGIPVNPEINTSNISRISYAMNNYSFKWNHSFASPGWFSNLTLSDASFSPSLSSPDSLIRIDVTNKIRSQSASFELILQKSNANYELGVESRLNRIEAGNYYENRVLKSSLPLEKSLESALFAAGEFDITPHLKTNLGLRYSFFHNLGPVVYRLYSTTGNEISEQFAGEQVTVTNNAAYNSYGGVEPRISLAYSITENSSVKAAFTMARQYIQILANNTTPLPVSRWKTSDIHLKPQVSKLYSVGYYRQSPLDGIAFSGELYYRLTTNFTDVKTGSDFLLEPFVETQLLQGLNKSVGLETSFEKVIDKSLLNLNYTYSRSFNKMAGESLEAQINLGEWYRSNFDRPHAFNANIKIQQSPIHHFSFSFTYSSGRPYTAPAGVVYLEGKNYPVYLNRNNARTPAYHRLDFSWLIENPKRTHKKYKSNWSFNVYNLYARKNVYSVFFNNSTGALKAYKLSVFASAIPSLSYNFTFE